MRVIMVTPCYYPAKGGTETIVRNLSIFLNRKKIHTDVMTFNMDRKWHPKWQGKVEKIDDINVFKIPALNWLPIAHSRKITMDVNLIPGRFTNLFKNYDIIHFHEELSFPFFSCFVKKPKIFQFHGWIDAGVRDFDKTYFLRSFILEHVAELCICLTKNMKRNLAELGISKDKITTLPNGVDIEIFRPSDEKKDNMVLFVGRIEFEKGIHILLKSLSYLEKAIHLVIIGPPGWNHKYFQEILRLIDNENKKGSHRVTYLGTQEQANVIKSYQKASIFVLPSFEEGFPVVILEALSCETPIVATNVGGIPEVVRDGENGILVPPSNAVKLAEAIQYLLDNKNVRTKLGKEGRRLVIEHFSISAVVKRLHRIYKNIVNQSEF